MSECSGNSLDSSTSIPSMGDSIVMPTYLKLERKERKEVEALNVKVLVLERTVKSLKKDNSEQADKLVGAWEEIKALKISLFDEEGAKIRAEHHAQQTERKQEDLRSSLIRFLGLVEEDSD